MADSSRRQKRQLSTESPTALPSAKMNKLEDLCSGIKNPSTQDLNILQEFINFQRAKHSANETASTVVSDASHVTTGSFQPKSIKGLRPRPLTTYVKPVTESVKFESLNPFKIRDYLKEIFPDNTPRIAFIQDDCLVIKASNLDDHNTFQGTWPETTLKVLQTGIKHINKESKYYVAFLKVSPSTLNVDSAEVKDSMRSELKISNMRRIVNRQTSAPTDTIQACVSCYDTYADMVTKGFVQIGSLRVRVRPWNFKEPTNQCFRCCRFGHKPERCPLIASNSYSCLRCTANHNYKECKVSPKDYKCTLCDGNHAAVSTTCPKQPKKKQPVPNQRQPNSGPPQGFTRNPSAMNPGPSTTLSYAHMTTSNSHTHQQTTAASKPFIETANTLGMISFVYQILKNFNQITQDLDALEDDIDNLENISENKFLILIASQFSENLKDQFVQSITPLNE